MTNLLTEAGYANIEKVLREHCGVKVTQYFIDTHYKTLSSFFEDGNDPFLNEMLEEGETPWWTFEEEANSGSISDTFPRDNLIDGFATVMIGEEWPMILHGEKRFHDFMSKLKKAVYEKEGVSFVE